jgi:prepilin-type N-terminal cleavage/methylation domain-containing protein
MVNGPHIHRPLIQEKAGFSLLELILVLALLGIIGLVGTMGFVRFSQGFVFARETTAITAKGQLAMMRLAKELQSLSAASTTTPPSRLAFTALRGGVEEDHEARLVGTSLFFDNQVLVDRVSGLVLSYYTEYDSGATAWSPGVEIRLIDILLTLDGPDNTPIELQTRVAIRNM